MDIIFQDSSGPKIFIDTTKISGTATQLNDSNSGYFNESSYGTAFTLNGWSFVSRQCWNLQRNEHPLLDIYESKKSFMDFVHLYGQLALHGTTTHNQFRLVPEVIVKRRTVTNRWSLACLSP